MFGTLQSRIEQRSCKKTLVMGICPLTGVGFRRFGLGCFHVRPSLDLASGRGILKVHREFFRNRKPSSKSFRKELQPLLYNHSLSPFRSYLWTTNAPVHRNRDCICITSHAYRDKSQVRSHQPNTASTQTFRCMQCIEYRLMSIFEAAGHTYLGCANAVCELPSRRWSSVFELRRRPFSEEKVGLPSLARTLTMVTGTIPFRNRLHTTN